MRMRYGVELVEESTQTDNLSKVFVPRKSSTSALVSSMYTNIHGAWKITNHYDKTLRNLPFCVEETTIRTSFGAAAVLSAGPHHGAIPLFIWQGTACPGPFTLLFASDLVPLYRVITADVPGQAGSRIEPFRFDKDRYRIGQWAAEIVEALAPERSSPILHIGISYGGGIVIDLARIHPELINAAVLVVPSSIHPHPSALKIVSWMLLYRWIPCTWTRNLLFSILFEDSYNPDDPIMVQQKLAFKYVSNFPAPAQLVGTKDELKNFTAPTFLITAKKDVFGDGDVMAARAREVFGPNLDKVEIVDGKHVISAHAWRRLVEEIIQYFASHGFEGIRL